MIKDKINLIKIMIVVTYIFSTILYPTDLCYSKNDSTSCNEIIINDLKACINTGSFFVESIKDISCTDAVYTLGTVGLFSVTFLHDENIQSSFKLNHTTTSDKFFKFTDEFGNLIFPFAFSSALYFGGLLFDNESVRVTGRMMIESLLLSGILVQSGKIIFGRSRPDAGNGSKDFRWFEMADKCNSLPSGHTATAMSVATVLAYRIDTWWSYPLFFSMATSTALARVYLNRHWMSDVFLGAVTGYLCGYMVIKAGNKKQIKSTTELQILPCLNGLTMVYTF